LLPTDAETSRPWEPIILIAVVTLVLVASGIRPYDRATWVLEVAPVVLGISILAVSYRRYPLSPLLYRLLFLHALLLLVGGHYTYARVPAGFFVQDLFDLSRNHYDRLGHFVQGFVPAILVREILLRESPLRRGGWLWLAVTSICLAFSAFYELIEWWVAVFSEDGSVDFLATQGDPWDTQWDMFLALLGALSAQAFLARAHDRSLRTLPTTGLGPKG